MVFDYFVISISNRLITDMIVCRSREIPAIGIWRSNRVMIYLCSNMIIISWILYICMTVILLHMKSYIYFEGGERVAFEKLFQEFYHSMCMHASFYVKDNDVAEDIVQEMFVALWSREGKFRNISDLKTFLYISVKNRCLNYIRDRREVVDNVGLERGGSDVVFKNWLIEEETYRILDNAINGLAPQSAQIIKMSLDGKQNKEIAEALNVSVNTVKTLKYNALNKLRVVLKDYFYILLLLLPEK